MQIKPMQYPSKKPLLSLPACQHIHPQCPPTQLLNISKGLYVPVRPYLTTHYAYTRPCTPEQGWLSRLHTSAQDQDDCSARLRVKKAPIRNIKFCRYYNIKHLHNYMFLSRPHAHASWHCISPADCCWPTTRVTSCTPHDD